MAPIEEVLVPLYLHHRYQVEAAATVVGGMHYIYAMRGDGREPVRLASAAEQRAALNALLEHARAVGARAAARAAREDPAAAVGLRTTRELLPALHGPDVRRDHAGGRRRRS